MKDILSEIIANKRFEVDLQKQAISIEQLQEGISESRGSKLNCVIVLFFLLASKISFHIEFIFRYLSESKIMVYLID